MVTMGAAPMKILHTSDWHLGNRMMNCSRTEEFSSFLLWLLNLMRKEKPDVLLISGDVFDTASPGDVSREMYCRFLSQADATGCRSVVITAGNHDGIAHLESARPLLKRHHCAVVTRLNAENAESCLIPITDDSHREIGLVCAVPFLRPNEVSLDAEEEDEEARKTAYTRGVAAVFERVGEWAEVWKRSHPGCPVVAMGHLPVQGVEKTASTRSPLGTLDVVHEDIFPPVFDYVALGHIHKPSRRLESRILYCGSPLPMGVDEASEDRQVLIVEWKEGVRCARAVAVPPFTRFPRAVCSNKEDLDDTLARLSKEAEDSDVPLWFSLTYAGGDLPYDELQEKVRQALPTEKVPVIATRLDFGPRSGEFFGAYTGTKLSDFTPENLFRKRWAEYEATHPGIATQRSSLEELFRSLLDDVNV